jgi:hypothetical protein
MSKFASLLSDLGIDESYTKAHKKAKVFTKVKDNVALIEDNNQQLDILYLPTSKFGYKYLLVAVDLATDEFDIEPMKTLTSLSCLNAYRNMFDRGYISKPKATVSTDGGAEFKGVFSEWLKENNLFHRISVPDRHSQQSNVESLNKTLGRLINGYLNKIELQTGKTATNWLSITNTIRDKLNKIRKKKVPDDINSYVYPYFDPVVKKNGKEIYVNAKYKIGESVYYLSEVPLTALGKKQNTKNFREADRRYNLKARKIEEIYYYSSPVFYRYKLQGLNNVSFTESQLKKA